MRKWTRRLYLIAAMAVSLAACAHVAANPWTARVDDDALRLYEFLVGLLIVAWLTTDPNLAKLDRPSIDHGFLHLTLFPFLAVYEQFAIRRWKGIAIVLGLFMLMFAPLFAVLIVP